MCWHLMKALLILLVTANFAVIWYKFYEEEIYHSFYFYDFEHLK